METTEAQQGQAEKSGTRIRLKAGDVVFVLRFPRPPGRWARFGTVREDVDGLAVNWDHGPAVDEFCERVTADGLLASGHWVWLRPDPALAVGDRVFFTCGDEGFWCFSPEDVGTVISVEGRLHVRWDNGGEEDPVTADGVLLNLGAVALRVGVAG